MTRRQFLSRSLAIGAGIVLAPSLLLARDSAASVEHTVVRGDTLTDLARRYNTTVGAIRKANNLRSDQINVGQKLIIPVSASQVSVPEVSAPIVHIVARGDTLSALALRYGTTADAIRKANNLRSDQINVGQKLLIPSSSHNGGFQYIDAVVRATERITIQPNRWQWIVGHHSAIERGNARIYGNYHRNQRRMENGLAYHFVIGNGVDSGEGEVEIGERWLRQIDGGHVRRADVNRTGIGICMVGNFESRRPSERQMAAFIELVDYLKNTVLGGNCRFAVHREIDPRHTVCPGRYFPIRAMHERYG